MKNNNKIIVSFISYLTILLGQFYFVDIWDDLVHFLASDKFWKLLPDKYQHLYTPNVWQAAHSD